MLNRLFIGAVLAAVSLAASAAALQTQYHGSGAEVDVIKAQVAGDVLTVVVRYRNDSGSGLEENSPLEEVYYIDPAENKKYQVLKDENGKWIANPVNNNGRIGVVCRDWGFKLESGAATVMWFKFPAPASGADAVNFVLPNVTPFDALPLAR